MHPMGESTYRRTTLENGIRVITEKMPGEYAMNITKEVFIKYEYYLSIKLTGENLLHFQNAVNYQLKAIYILKDSIDPYGYIYWMNEASKKYDDINII